MRLTDYAKKLGFQYQTVWKWYKAGKLPNAHKTPSGRIFIDMDNNTKTDYIITYARVSSSKNKSNLVSQSKRLQDFCSAKGWVVQENVTEVGSGLNDKRRKIQKILNSKKITKIVVEHKDRLTRFGFNYLTTLLSQKQCEIIIINQDTDDRKDLMEDFVSLVTSFTARLYGFRRCKRNTEKLIKKLELEKTNSKK